MRVKAALLSSLVFGASIAWPSPSRAGDETEAEKAKEKERQDRQALAEVEAGVREQEVDNFESLMLEDTGKTHLQSFEIVAATDRTAFHHDQQGRIGPGFEWSLSFKGAENMRFLAVRHALLWGQLGDERRAWYHMQTAYVPTFRFAGSMAISGYVGPRAFHEMTFVTSRQAEESNQEEIVAHAVGFGGTLGMRLLDGILSAEATLDAVAALERPFVVDDHSSNWIFPRLGFNVKTDLCAFIGGGACQYPAPRPEDIDLARVLEQGINELKDSKIGPSCDRIRAAIQIESETKNGVTKVPIEAADACGPADADGFFCRLLVSAPSDLDRDLVEATRQVHAELAACYDQNRADEQTAARLGKVLRQKMRYASNPPRLSERFGCDPRAEGAKSAFVVAERRERDDEDRKDALDEALAKTVDEESCRLVDAEEACPRARLALYRLEKLIEKAPKPAGTSPASAATVKPPSTSKPWEAQPSPP